MDEVIKVDSKGRLLIPKSLREKVEINEGSYVTVRSDGKSIVIEPTVSTAEKYYGRFKVESVPPDLDEYVKGEILRNWLKKHTST